MPNGAIDDTALRREAERLVRQLQQQLPTIALAQHVIDSSQSCSFVVEVKITSAGPVASTVLLDMSDLTENRSCSAPVRGPDD